MESTTTVTTLNLEQLSDSELVARRDAAVARLVDRINYEHWQDPPYNQRDFKLDRMRELLRRLGDPQRGLRIVHIAGTKGKGSTAAMIGATLTAAGARTGLFTSPHLERLEERMTIDGGAPNAAEMVELFETVWPTVLEMDREAKTDPDSHGAPTYFEITTALALLHFARRRAEAAVLEVGLGGRLDSTNVCTPEISVITNISFDHTQQLGDTLAEIAREKAGIIKPASPVVSGVTPAEPRRVIQEIARSRGAELYELGDAFRFSYHPTAGRNGDRPAPPSLDFEQTRPMSKAYRRLQVGLLGRHQTQNAAMAVATLEVLSHRGWNIPPEAVREGLKTVKLPGRVEIVTERPTVVLDVAHNVASAEALSATLRECFPAKRKSLIFAAPRDKDVEGMLRALLPEFDRVVVTRYQTNPRAMPVDELARLVRRLTLAAPESFATLADAWRHVWATTRAEELICVAGSFFLAAEIRPAILESATTAQNSKT